MWLDYKGKRHFLPTEMPEEPKKVTATTSFIAGLCYNESTMDVCAPELIGAADKRL